VRRSWTIEGRSFVYFTRRRMPKKPTIRGAPWPRSTRAQAAGRLWDWNPARSRPSDHHERLKRWGDEHGATRAERVPFRPRFTEKATRPDFKNSDKASPLLFHFSEQSAQPIRAYARLGSLELASPYRSRSAFASSVRPWVPPHPVVRSHRHHDMGSAGAGSRRVCACSRQASRSRRMSSSIAFNSVNRSSAMARRSPGAGNG
jgi:hypothetical protein